MDEFAEYIQGIEPPEHREIFQEVVNWVESNYPNLGRRLGWGMPMFIDHGTFIVSFKATKNALAMSPETKTLQKFAKEIETAGWKALKMNVNIPWSKPLDYNLLAAIITFNIEDKADVETFWRGKED